MQDGGDAGYPHPPKGAITSQHSTAQEHSTNDNITQHNTGTRARLLAHNIHISAANIADSACVHSSSLKLKIVPRTPTNTLLHLVTPLQRSCNTLVTLS
jgi:hypothetical protein